MGRTEEIATLTALMARTRLLTLTGSGGVGKTRLALQWRRDLVDRYPDGVWLVELAALAEQRPWWPDAWPEIAGQTRGSWIVPSLEHHRPPADKHLLLVLDNCEHLVAACAALVEAVLRLCPGVQVLATSREALEVAGEHRYRVPSLPVPDLAHLPPLEQLAEAGRWRCSWLGRSERGRLRTHGSERAGRGGRSARGWTASRWPSSWRPHGSSSLSVEGIAARLDDRFRLLTGGPRRPCPASIRCARPWTGAMTC